MEQKLSIPESRDATKQEKGDFYAERQNSSTCGVRKYCCVQDRIACQCTEKAACQCVGTDDQKRG